MATHRPAALVTDAPFITGQVITVDGGLSLVWACPPGVTSA